jgi:hypothetical protein
MKLIILKMRANHHSEYIATRASQRDISQNRNQSAREKFLKEKEIKRLLSKRSNPSRENTSRSEGNLRTDTKKTEILIQNCPEEADDKRLCSKQIKSFKENAQQRTETQETILRTEIIL